MKDTRIILLGEDTPTGCYLLRIQLSQSRQIQFGRFKHGGAFFLPKGEYLYVGSALGQKGSSSLGSRLLRHLTRSSGTTPHAIQEELVTRLYNAGIKAKVPGNKRCHWHIDYLLDIPEAEVIGIIVLHSREDREKGIAEMLAALAETNIPIPGLGASDHPGGTHLFHVQAGTRWWNSLPKLVLDTANPDDGLAKI